MNNVLQLADRYDDCPICWQNFVEYIRDGYKLTVWMDDARQILDAALFVEGGIRYFAEHKIEFKSEHHKLLFELKWS